MERLKHFFYGFLIWGLSCGLSIYILRYILEITLTQNEVCFMIVWNAVWVLFSEYCDLRN